MRTTIELDGRLRARLVQVAAERGEKGYSHLINEAVEAYLREYDAAARREQVERIIAAAAKFTAEQADHFEKVMRETRRS